MGSRRLYLALCCAVLAGLALVSRLRREPESRWTLAFPTAALDQPLFWPPEVEAAMPAVLRGSRDESCRNFRQRFLNEGVHRIRASSDHNLTAQDPCGRVPNAELELKDGSRLCARQRGEGRDYYVAASTMTFVLARLLRIPNLPCLTLYTAQPDSVWGHQLNVSKLGWTEGAVVGLGEWVDGLQPVALPPILVDAFHLNRTLRRHELFQGSLKEQAQLAQWSDMFVLDFLSGHNDRLIFLLWEIFNRHSRAQLERALIHNMAVDGEGALWFFDNESAFFRSYHDMYDTAPGEPQYLIAIARTQITHATALQSLCTFRQSTVKSRSRELPVNIPGTAPPTVCVPCLCMRRWLEAVRRLVARRGSAAAQLLGEAQRREPLVKRLIADFHNDERFDMFTRHFGERLRFVADHFERCERHFEGGEKAEFKRMGFVAFNLESDMAAAKFQHSYALSAQV